MGYFRVAPNRCFKAEVQITYKQMFLSCLAFSVINEVVRVACLLPS